MIRYYITDRKALGSYDALFEAVRRNVQQSVEMIQIREKDLSARELLELVRSMLSIRDEMAQAGRRTKILVNGRSDVAAAAKADGVHLPADAPAEVLKGLYVIRSCHSLAEVKNAQGVDAVVFGPVFATPDKSSPSGIDSLRQACRFGIPVFALGGVNRDNAQACIDAGAAGIAGIRLFQEMQEPFM